MGQPDTVRASFVTVLLGLGLGCAPPLSPPQEAVAYADCATPVGGIDLSDTVEGEPGYDAQLAAIDEASLPPTLSLSGLSRSVRATLAYALEIPPASLGETLDTATLLAGGEMGRAVAASFSGGAFDFAFFRRGFHRFYACTRRLPLTLDGFAADFVDIRALPRRVIPHSQPKNGERHILEDEAAQVFAAETPDGQGGVREFEIMVGGRRADGFFDFLVYDGDGDLMDGSTFATAQGDEVAGSAPLTCMACHTDGARGFAYDVVDPSR